MPKYYCDYCDIFLTHDSASVRKAHNTGWKHINQVASYYRELDDDKTQEIIDRITEAYEGKPPIVQPNDDRNSGYSDHTRRHQSYSDNKYGQRQYGPRRNNRREYPTGRDRNTTAARRGYDLGDAGADRGYPGRSHRSYNSSRDMPPPHSRYPPPPGPPNLPYGMAPGPALSAPPHIRDQGPPPPRDRY
ncbi:zf-U1-domain-containing protein [Coemansia reversa NRRL 1564]|uniref:Zf-U1-domain-containing protein n=1 Tax=Coemansia reversa (strain ATCC 12441 / NRRL 1564) TaxID=763665 RepID=A0A2G5B9T2_COERN|nr:zf-U1-domain-containing protein [Coemansia reversa NRRL 1564]|eukprot:PIA15732.1 zf-U1-domain-containing protein [Coemansia reversa NRRL 1564]